MSINQPAADGKIAGRSGGEYGVYSTYVIDCIYYH